MPTLTLLVEEEPGHGKRLVWDGIPVLAGEHQPRIDALGDGARLVADCRYTRDGLVLREIKEALAQRGPTAAEQARRLLDQGRPGDALRKLEALAAGSVERDKHLLELRMRAYAAQNRQGDLGQDFGRLLQLADLDPPDARRAFALLSEQTRPFWALRFAQWASANFAAVRRWGTGYVLDAIPLPQWPLDLVLAELGRLLDLPSWSAGLPNGTELETLHAQAQQVAPADPRVKALGPQIQAKLAELARGDADQNANADPHQVAHNLALLPGGWGTQKR